MCARCYHVIKRKICRKQFKTDSVVFPGEFEEGHNANTNTLRRNGAPRSISIDTSSISARTEISTLKDLRPGDHISFHRRCSFWHHALVTEVDPAGLWVRLIQYGPRRNSDRTLWEIITNKGIVEERRVDINPVKERLYRMDYYDQCFDPCEVIARARARLGETSYNVVGSNCEHLVRWCKVGKCYCVQRREVVKNGVMTAVTCGCKATARGLGYAAQFGGTSSREMVGAGIAVFLEGSMLICDIKRARKRVKEGKISNKEYSNIVKKKTSTRVCATVGELAGGLLGLLILVHVFPWLGAVCSYVLANLCGLLGAIIGALIGSAFLQSS
jgi:hypothetical protein